MHNQAHTLGEQLMHSGEHIISSHTHAHLHTQTSVYRQDYESVMMVTDMMSIAIDCLLPVVCDVHFVMSFSH